MVKCPSHIGKNTLLIISLSILSILIVFTFKPSEKLNHISPTIEKSYQYWVQNPDSTQQFPSNSDWQPIEELSFNLGYTHEILWVKFDFNNTSSREKNFYINANYNLLDLIRVYKFNQNSFTHVQDYGDIFPFNERDLDIPTFAIPINLDGHAKESYVLRINGNSTLKTNMTFIEADNTNEYMLRTVLVHTSIVMIIFIMTLYNLFQYFLTNIKLHLQYSAYSFTLMVMMMHLTGYGYHFIWYDYPLINQYIFLPLVSGLIFTATVFIKDLLQFTFVDESIGHKNFVRLTLIASSPSILSPLFIDDLTACYQIANVHIVSSILFLLCIVIYKLISKSELAWYFLLSWQVLLAGSIVASLNRVGVIETYVGEIFIYIGAASEAILLAMIVGLRISNDITRQEKAVQKALIAEQKYRHLAEEYLEKEKQQSQILQERVEERTKDLNEAYNSLHEAYEQLSEISNTDPLTGLKNRACFNEFMQSAYSSAKRNQHPIAVLFCDIDHFKGVNDNYGHGTGDEALKVVAQIMLDIIQRSQDCIARFGGEEFVAVITDTQLDDVLNLAERIRTQVESTLIEYKRHKLNITISIGAAYQQQEYSTEGELIDSADMALYRAKENGRNQVQLFENKNKH